MFLTTLFLLMGSKMINQNKKRIIITMIYLALIQILSLNRWLCLTTWWFIHLEKKLNFFSRVISLHNQFLERWETLLLWEQLLIKDLESLIYREDNCLVMIKANLYRIGNKSSQKYSVWLKKNKMKIKDMYQKMNLLKFYL